MAIEEEIAALLPQRPEVPIGGQTGEEQARQDAKLARDNQLEIKALVHEALFRQIQTKRGLLARPTARDMHVLEVMLTALEQVPTTAEQQQ
jgi:hypothetical protein